MEFENWWNRNKDLYSLVNVTKEVAKAIWSDAVFITENSVSKQVIKILKSHE